MERIGGEVERALGRTSGGDTAVITRITSVWTEVVGDAVARNAWPLRVGRDGTLHVATTSSTWAFELDRLSTDIAERLAPLLGSSAPVKLRFRPGPVPEPGASSRPPEAPSEAPAHADPEVVAEAAELAAAINDPELRELVARAARASLQRARSGRLI